MGDDEPITRREFAEGIKAITDRLDKLNGAVAENTLFRVQQKTVYWVIGVGWGIVMIPLLTIVVAVLT